MDLVQLKTRLDEAERKQNHLNGQKDMVLKNLKELGYSSLKEAEEGIESLQEKIDKMETDLNKGILIFKEKYKDLLV